MLNNKLKRLIDSAEIVSFDIFDTIIERTTNNPNDIFDIVQMKYNTRFTKIEKFRENRINAEKEARLNTNFEEVSLEDIYNCLHKHYPNANIQHLMEIEKQVEIRVCRKRKDNYDLIKYCFDNDKKVIISSDMYLPKDIIEIILRENKIKYSKLYLSSDIRKTKSTGSMFKFIISENNINSKKILHIGDNLKSDYIIPKINGLKAVLVKKYENPNYNDILVDYAIKCAENDLQNENIDYFYRLGYKYLGIIMVNFCRYLNSNVKNKNKIIFLSREGQFIKKCYDLMFKNNSQYMYVSRKSVSGALLYYYNNVENMIKDQSLSPAETIESFLKRWDIINDDTYEFLHQKDINLNSNISDKNELNKIQKVLFELKIKANAKNKNILFTKYLEQFKIDSTTSLVDIGWSGTMHDLIQLQLTKRNTMVESYYLGLRAKKKNKSKHGFLFDGKEDDIEILSRSMVGFLEILFNADHGTTLGYKQEKELILPVLSKNDISDFEMKQIQKIQKGCLNFITNYKDDDIISLSNNSRESYYPLFNYCINPKLIDIKKFEQFCVVDEKEYNLIGNRYGIRYIFHPKKFVNDYIFSCWKNAYLKSIFKVKLPYNQIFKFAYRRRS